MCGKGRAVHKTKSEKPNIKWDRHLGTTEGLEEESAYNLFFLLKATGCFQVSKNKIVACVFQTCDVLHSYMELGAGTRVL